jgi:hypothetical protein
MKEELEGIARHYTHGRLPAALERLTWALSNTTATRY